MYTYKARATRVVDGDTLDTIIDLGFKISTTHRLRLLGIDTPERWEAGFNEATDRLRELVECVEFTITTEKSDAFGRYLAVITLEDGTNVNDTMVEEGLAEIYKR